MNTKEQIAENVRELKTRRDALRTELDQLYVEVFGSTLEEEELYTEIFGLETQMQRVRETDAEYRRRDAERSARQARQGE